MVKNMHICIIIMIMPLSYANLKQSLYYSIFFLLYTVLQQCKTNKNRLSECITLMSKILDTIQNFLIVLNNAPCVTCIHISVPPVWL